MMKARISQWRFRIANAVSMTSELCMFIRIMIVELTRRAFSLDATTGYKASQHAFIPLYLVPWLGSWGGRRFQTWVKSTRLDQIHHKAARIKKSIALGKSRIRWPATADRLLHNVYITLLYRTPESLLYRNQNTLLLT